MANVDELLKIPFSGRLYADTLNIVKGEKPKPVLNDLNSKHKDKKREYTRHFSASQYANTEWLTGCDVRFI